MQYKEKAYFRRSFEAQRVAHNFSFFGAKIVITYRSPYTESFHLDSTFGDLVASALSTSSHKPYRKMVLKRGKKYHSFVTMSWE